MLGKKLSDKQVEKLIVKGKTTKLKGFVVPGREAPSEGKLVLTADGNIELMDS